MFWNAPFCMCAIRRVNEAHSKLQLKSVSVDEIMILLCPNGQYLFRFFKIAQNRVENTPRLLTNQLSASFCDPAKVPI
jgi:hypothetical protein